MNIISTIVIISDCIILTFCPGCLSQQTAPSPVTQGVPIPATPATSGTSVPVTLPLLIRPATTSAAQLSGNNTLYQNVTGMPFANAIDIGVEKDHVYNMITETFIGGPGQVLVRNVLVRG